MLLVLDVGNTDSCAGIFRGKIPIFSVRVSTPTLKTFFYRKNRWPIESAIISSVVPGMDPKIRIFLKKWGIKRVKFVSHQLKSLISLNVDRPSEVGADRIVNAVAAYSSCSSLSSPRKRGSLHQKSFLVIDLGTATTIDYIDCRGAYRGGVIIPGLKISAEALFERAAKLFKVELKAPKRILGRNTISQLQSGTVLAYAFMLDATIQNIKKEVREKPKIVLTGGLGFLMTDLLSTPHHFEPNLTLKGLQILADYNGLQS